MVRDAQTAAAIGPPTLGQRLWAVVFFFPALLVSTALFGSLALLLAPLAPRLSNRCGALWSRWLLFCGRCRARYRGAEHLRPGQAYVIMANHASLVDIPALYAFGGWSFRWVMKAELRRVPFLGWATAAQGCVFIDRQDPAAAIASLRRAARLLAAGTSIMIFPEGTRSADGRLGPFKKGGFMLALEAGLPILPVSVAGSDAILPSRSLALRPGTITVTLHQPLDPAPYGLAGRERLMADARAAIASALPREAPAEALVSSDV